MDFVHLHVHTTYSLLDGQCGIKPLVRKAREWGMPALAVTDHGNLFALKAFYDECRAEKGYEGLPPIKPILGCEAYVVDHDYRERAEYFHAHPGLKERRFHLCLHALNLTGYHNLVRLISEAHVNGSYMRPRIDHALLEKYHEGLHCSSACIAGEVAYYLDDGVKGGNDPRKAEEIARWYKDVFGENYSLEVMLHRSAKTSSAVPEEAQEEHRVLYARQVNVMRRMLELGRRIGVPVVATNDVHFLDAADDDSHDVLLCLSTNKKLSDRNRLVYTGEEWFKPLDEMRRIFSENPEILANTLRVAERVEEYKLDSDPIMPKFPIPAEFGTEEAYAEKFDEEALRRDFNTLDKPKNFERLGGYEKVLRVKFESDYLASLVWAGAKRRWGDPVPKDVAERVQFELDTIRTMGFPGYFLIVHDYIAAARRMGVWVGPGRGSAAGAAVAYALGITNVDPIKFDLLFERFLNPDRVSMPDIDVDFDDAGRGRVLEYVTQKYGQDHVAHIVTFGQMAAKSAIKDVGRVMEYDLAATNKLAALVPDTPKITFKAAMSEKAKKGEPNKDFSPELKNAANDLSNPVVYKLLSRARRLEGCIRQPGVHACGVIISRDPLIDTLPVMPTENESLLTTQYDGHFVEPVGLLKMDFLGLKTLTVEKECVDLIRRFRAPEERFPQDGFAKNLDTDRIPDDDEETYRLFGRGETTGLFQFESDGMKKYLRELQPSRLSDLVAMNALYRPGPLAYIPTFIARKLGQEPISYDHPLMEKYLKDTYGVTVYQEQVMLLSRHLGGFTRGMSDKLRKAMGKKQIAVMEELKAKFVDGCLANPDFRVDRWKDEKEARRLIDKIWDDWKAFASYAFNKSHAVCYAWVAYQTGYLKAHYPAEFMCAQISSEIGNFDKLPGFVAEAAAMGLEVRLPDVNAAFPRFSPVRGEKAILYGLGGIKGVGEKAAEAIVAEREKNGPFTGFYDFCMRLASASEQTDDDGKKQPAAVNKRVLEALVRAGAFDSFIAADPSMHRARYFNNIDFALKRAVQRAREKASAQTDFFAALSGGEEKVHDADLADCPRWLPADVFRGEKELTGLYLTGHPLGAFRRALETLSTVRPNALPEVPYLKDLPDPPPGRTKRQARVAVRLGGLLKTCTVRMSKPKKEGDLPQPWAILEIDAGEEAGEMEALCFAKTYEKYREWLPGCVDKPVLVCGELAHRTDRENRALEEEGLQFVVREAYPLEKGVRTFSKALVVRLDHQDGDLLGRVVALKNAAAAHPGLLPIALELEYPDGRRMKIDTGISGVSPSESFFTELGHTFREKDYRLKTISDCFAEPRPERPWERR